MWSTAKYPMFQRGLSRGSPKIITNEIEEKLTAREKVQEGDPGWAMKVPRLEEMFMIPAVTAEAPHEYLSARFSGEKKYCC